MPGESHQIPSRSRITAGELVIVCSHYDLGVIEEVRRFRGGSRLAPKVLIKTQWGEFLLKRRAPGPANEPSKVAFTHEVITHLAAAGFPAPPPLATRDSKLTMLQLGPSSPGGGGVYEVFRFIRGERFDRTPASAWAAGWWLGRCHLLLSNLRPLFPAPRRTFHNHPQVPERLASISGLLKDPSVRGLCRGLGEAYQSAATRVEDLIGSPEPALQIVHGDWHPGNMLFRIGASAPEQHGVERVAAVLDFDSARLGQTMHDFANGAMQFSVHRSFGQVANDSEADRPQPASPPPKGASTDWKIALDPGLFSAFAQGYAEAGAGVDKWLTQERAQAVPWLMIEALIVEAAVPIASTGQFGKLAAKPVLEVVQRAVDAIALQSDKLAGLVAQRP